MNEKTDGKLLSTPQVLGCALIALSLVGLCFISGLFGAAMYFGSMTQTVPSLPPQTQSLIPSDQAGQQSLVPNDQVQPGQQVVVPTVSGQNFRSTSEQPTAVAQSNPPRGRLADLFAGQATGFQQIGSAEARDFGGGHNIPFGATYGNFTATGQEEEDYFATRGGEVLLCDGVSINDQEPAVVLVANQTDTQQSVHVVDGQCTSVAEAASLQQLLDDAHMLAAHLAHNLGLSTLPVYTYVYR